MSGREPIVSAPNGPFRAHSAGGELTQGKPWAKLCWPLRATEYAASVIVSYGQTFNFFRDYVLEMFKLQAPLKGASPPVVRSQGFNADHYTQCIDGKRRKPSATIIVWKASLDGANSLEAYALFSGLAREVLKSSCRRAFSYARRDRDGVK